MPYTLSQFKGDGACIPQGSNNPLVIEFDEEVVFFELSVSLWSNATGYKGKPLKIWTLDDITMDGNKAICPLTEEETASFPPSGPSSGSTFVEIKGLDENGYTLYWERCNVYIEARKDREIKFSGGV